MTAAEVIRIADWLRDHHSEIELYDVPAHAVPAFVAWWEHFEGVVGAPPCAKCDQHGACPIGAELTAALYMATGRDAEHAVAA